MEELPLLLYPLLAVPFYFLWNKRCKSFLLQSELLSKYKLWSYPLLVVKSVNQILLNQLLPLSYFLFSYQLWVLRKGDRLTIHIHMPLEMPFEWTSLESDFRHEREWTRKIFNYIKLSFRSRRYSIKRIRSGSVTYLGSTPLTRRPGHFGSLPLSLFLTLL